MKTFQIEDAKTRFFTDKEHYLNFKQAWKDFHNSDKLKWYDDVDITFWDAPRNAPRVYARTKFTALNASHYMLYNLLRGYDTSRGFIEHSEHGWEANEEAAGSIVRAAKVLRDINADSEWSRKWAREAIDKMLLPFGDTVSNEMLHEIAGELYTHLSGQTLPQIEIEEKREFEKPRTMRKTIADTVKALGRV